MAETRRSSGRRGTACQRCHRQKVKCSREIPCRNCRAARVECSYNIRERSVNVPESYLRRLEAGRDNRVEAVVSPRASSVEHGRSLTNDANDKETRRHFPPPIENSAAEVFIAKIKQLGQNPDNDVGTIDSELNSQNALPSLYDYFPLQHDTSHSKMTVNLPPYPYAVHLLSQVEIYIAHDYHWFLWRSFAERMERCYSVPSSPESKDRMWLCLMLIVFSLGETFVKYHAPAIHLGSSSDPIERRNTEAKGTNSIPPAPGIAYFEQALALLKIPYEEPSVEHVEILNLAAFYSYSLNRLKDAYMYAGMSARMCNLLRLHQPPAPNIMSALEQEHRKRVCWTSYCVDKMTSSEQGLWPSFQPGQIKVDYPSNAGLLPGDEGQFHEAEFLQARIKLTFMKADADAFIDVWKSVQDDIPDVERRVRPTLVKLEAWLAELPSWMSFDCEFGIPDAMANMPTWRSLTSLYIRFNQCCILLLRPLFLKNITYLLSDEPYPENGEEFKTLSNTCLKAARSNLSMFLDMSRQGKIANFGFWDSTHLFTGLIICCLSMAVNRRQPGSLDEKAGDLTIYDSAKLVLHEMAVAGNLASKGHEKMLSDVEILGEALSAQVGGSQNLQDQWDMDNWISQVLSIDPSFMTFNTLE